jgi:bifunctional NMN adenylyltransferase/nudix hydrolase
VIKPSYGVVVGRFQVTDLTEGHMELFRQVRRNHKTVIVFVGVAPASLTQNHPLDFPTRKIMIQAKFPEFIVLPLRDTRDDGSWSEQLDYAISGIADFGDVTLYGGRDSFVPHYHGRFKPVELALSVDASISATDNRKEHSNKVLDSSDFRAGMIYAIHHLWPVTLMMVDVAILSYDRSEVLLARKPNENKWRFVGGHVEARKGSIEKNGRLEAMEEAGVDLIDQEYVGSAIIDDWRYRVSDRSVMTALFAGRVSNMAAVAKDDVCDVKWFSLDKLTTFDMMPEHMELLVMLKDYLKKFKEAPNATSIQAASTT